MLTSDNPLDTYCANKSKNLFLRNPCLKFLHTFLAYAFSGRKDASNILTRTELFFLWCMVSGHKLNFGLWLVTQVSSVLSYSRTLIISSVITSLSVNLHLFYPEHIDLHHTSEPTLMDLCVLDDMGLLRKVGDAFSLTLTGPVMLRNERVF